MQRAAVSKLFSTTIDEATTANGASDTAQSAPVMRPPIGMKWDKIASQVRTSSLNESYNNLAVPFYCTYNVSH